MTHIARKRPPRWKQARVAIHDAISERTEKAAEDLRDYIGKSLDAAQHGIDSDTHALAQSLYVKATGRDDYDLALGEARAAFLSNPSKFRGQSASEKSRTNFESLIAPKQPLAGEKPHASVAIVATMLAYGYFWEYGHDNTFTRIGDDKRPWMLPAALEWAHSRLADFYRDLRVSI